MENNVPEGLLEFKKQYQWLKQNRPFESAIWSTFKHTVSKVFPDFPTAQFLEDYPESNAEPAKIIAEGTPAPLGYKIWDGSESVFETNKKKPILRASKKPAVDEIAKRVIPIVPVGDFPKEEVLKELPLINFIF